MQDALLSAITDTIAPGLFCLALVVSWRAGRGGELGYRPWLQLGLGLLLVYGLQALDDRLRIWPAFGLDYSTHMAFAVMSGAGLVSVNRHWSVFVLGVLCTYAWLMRYFNYHSFADMLTTALIIVVGTGLCHRLLARILR
jgi:hypothetical protein